MAVHVVIRSQLVVSNIVYHSPDTWQNLATSLVTTKHVSSHVSYSHSPKMAQKSLIESHNALSLSAVRSAYLPASCLDSDTHAITLETSLSVSGATFATCFELVRNNMRDMYGTFNGRGLGVSVD